MKNCILTPTYKGHFKYIEQYLLSYNKYVVDAKRVTICFVLSSRAEVKEFQHIIAPYEDSLDIKVYIFDEIIKEYGIELDTDKILEKYGHTSYQMLKKFYSMLYIDAENFLVLDSEAVWIKSINMERKFEEFFDKPYVLVSDFSSRTVSSEYLEDHFDATNFILGYKMEKMPFEHFMWFYKKIIVEKMIEKYGKPYEMMLQVYEWEMETKGHSVGLMETMLCLNYLYENAGALGYQIISAEDELMKYLGKEECERYINRFFESSYGGHLGILEFPCDMLSVKNRLQMAKLFKENRIWITRCDAVTFWNKKYIEEFMINGDIALLAVGQEHIFLPELSKYTVYRILWRTSVKEIVFKVKCFIKKVVLRR